MKIFIGCDHAAFSAKESLKKYLMLDHEVEDVGTHSTDNCHYPYYAIEVCRNIIRNPGSVGILMCASGIGMSIVANRFKGIRAAVCRDIHDAKLSRSHNDANILCLGAKMSSPELVKDISTVWLKGIFDSGRHAERIEIFKDYGSDLF